MNFGDKLNQILCLHRGELFKQGELSHLTHMALITLLTNLRNTNDESFVLGNPIGYNLLNKQPIPNNNKRSKEEIINHVVELSTYQTPKNGIVQLVTILETILKEILRAVLLKFPQKLGEKLQVDMSCILGANSLEEIHIFVTDKVLNELSYKSPRDFAKELKEKLSIDLLECPSFHKYMEIKATRDIVIHNHGIANSLYIKKANSHARARKGEAIPIDIEYFLESYEHCLRLTEWLEKQLHSHWQSLDYEKRQQTQQQNFDINILAQTLYPESIASSAKIGTPSVVSKEPQKRRNKKTKKPKQP
jgi:hypothetical protein